MKRLLAGLAAAFAIFVLAVAPVAAGSWASITPDEGAATAEPIAGEPVDLGFTVLQHGQTPAPWVTASVVLVNAATGERITSEATPTGQDGHFVATATPSAPGLWTWSVELVELDTDPAAVPLAVRQTDGTMPPIDPATVVALVEQAKADVRAELRGEYANRLESLQRAVDVAQTQATAAMKRVVAESETLAAVQGRVDSLSTGAGTSAGSGADVLAPTSLLAVACVAVLAAAITAFLMLRLGRPGPTEVPVAEPARTGLAASR